MKYSFLAVLIAAFALSLVACNDNGKGSDTEKADVTAEDTYSCPMHPDVTGKKGDKCPKCGMALTPSAVGETSNAEYFMEFKAGSNATAGQAVMLSLIPKIKGRESEPVALDLEHEKKIHLIAVSEDLAWFDHIHPEYNADGSYTVNETFPAGGKYLLFADYKPTSGRHTVDKIEMSVSGTPAPAKTFTADQLSGTAGSYSFTLQANGGKFVSGVEMHMAGIIAKDGKEIDATTLENYLGAKAHIVTIDVAEKKYLHIHPEVSNGRFHLHTTFEKPGTYRWWVQFKADGKVQTIDLTTNVVEGSEADRRAANEGHAEISGEGHGHTGH